jgi:hypothetical protein
LNPAQPAGEQGQPGTKTYVDAMAALVPAEVLALYAVIMQVASVTKEVDGQSETVITHDGTVVGLFLALVVLSSALYLLGRKPLAGANAVAPDKFDAARALIPPCAFVVWTLLTPSSAIDAMGWHLDPVARIGGSAILAIVLGVAAAALGAQADRANPGA